MARGLRLVSHDRSGYGGADHVAGAESALSDTDRHQTHVIERIGDVHEWLIRASTLEWQERA